MRNCITSHQSQSRFLRECFALIILSSCRSLICFVRCICLFNFFYSFAKKVQRLFDFTNVRPFLNRRRHGFSVA